MAWCLASVKPEVPSVPRMAFPPNTNAPDGRCFTSVRVCHVRPALRERMVMGSDAAAGGGRRTAEGGHLQQRSLWINRW